ncbi:MAG: TonB-dependent receptor [Alphaproteobacteria bacterium]
MLPKPVVARSLRAALLGSIAGTLAVGVTPALAQDQSSRETAQQTIIVTGSRIPQANLKSVSPIQTIDEKEFKLQGKTEVSDILNNLPQAFQVPAIDFSNTPNPLSGPGGVTTADLRGLGPQRTLVLMDGVRLGPGDSNAGNPNPAPDLDQIPGQLVERVDVVTGGASAVYGSDAVAGVVNFIMKKDLQGIQIDAQYGLFTHTNGNSPSQAALAYSGFPIPKKDVVDGRNKDLSIAMGVNSGDGMGNITAYFGYHNQAPVTQGQRDYSSCLLVGGLTFLQEAPFNLPLKEGFACAGSSNSNEFINTNNGSDFTVVGSNFEPFGTPGGSPPNYFNPNPFQYLSRGDERYTAGYFAHYDINDHLKLYSDLNFMDDRSVTKIGPTALFKQDGAQLVNCDNPLLSAQQHAALCDADQVPDIVDDPATPEDETAGIDPAVIAASLGPQPAGATESIPVVIGRRDIEGGPRVSFYEHQSYRLLVGAKGDLFDGWTYDAYGQYYYATIAQQYNRDFNLERIAKALQVVDVGGVPTCKSVVDKTDLACVPWNIFAQGGVTQAALDYISADGVAWGDTKQLLASASVTGDLARYGMKSPLASDGVSTALGVEYRRESESYKADSLWQSGALAGAGGALPASEGGYDVKEGYIELRVPFIQDKPWIKDLTLDGGYRHSEYSLAGGTDTYKVTLDWEPSEDIRFRGSFQRAVRAPNLADLFIPNYVTNSAVLTVDPCAPTVDAAGNTVPATATLAQCANTGVTAAQYGDGGATSNIIQCPAAQCSVEQGGNDGTLPGVPALKPEKSNTYSWGAVLTPHWIPGLNFSIDYWKINQHGLIGINTPGGILQDCLTTGNPASCVLVVRSSQGYLFGNTIAGGGFVNTPLQNLTGAKNSGIDFQGTYSHPLWNNWGSVQLAFVGSELLSAVTNGGPGSVYDCAGLWGNTCGIQPEWRHTLRASWDSPWDFLISAQWRYFGTAGLDAASNQTALQDPALTPGLPWATIPSVSYFDLSGTWNFRPGVTFRGGINNILDKDPPVIPGAGDVGNNSGEGASGVGGPNAYPTYDLLGREFFLGVNFKF